MYITCLDMEGVLVPEIWIAFAEATGIPELKRTTRDEPDYDKLMAYRPVSYTHLDVYKRQMISLVVVYHQNHRDDEGNDSDRHNGNNGTGDALGKFPDQAGGQNAQTISPADNQHNQQHICLLYTSGGGSRRRRRHLRQVR